MPSMTCCSSNLTSNATALAFASINFNLADDVEKVESLEWPDD